MSTGSTKRIRGIFLNNDPAGFPRVWQPRHQARLREMLDLFPGVIGSADLEQHREWLAETEVAFSTWGMPCLTEAQLDLMPRLRAVFYAAGAIHWFSAPLNRRGIDIFSANAVNAIPVAEFTLSQILFGLKRGWAHIQNLKAHPGKAGWKWLEMPGAYRSRVGIVSLGAIGRKVCELLAPFDLEVVACDPFAPADCFERLHAKRLDLAELFATSDIVSLHTPWTPETEGLITGALLGSMKPNATFINTARGALVREGEMIDVLRRRPDLTAVLDVTHPEPAAADSPLFQLPNVMITPHIAGSAGGELARMADAMIAEYEAWATRAVEA